jgi:hypothetical protein
MSLPVPEWDSRWCNVLFFGMPEEYGPSQSSEKALSSILQCLFHGRLELAAVFGHCSSP